MRQLSLVLVRLVRPATVVHASAAQTTSPPFLPNTQPHHIRLTVVGNQQWTISPTYSTAYRTTPLLDHLERQRLRKALQPLPKLISLRHEALFCSTVLNNPEHSLSISTNEFSLSYASRRLFPDNWSELPSANLDIFRHLLRESH
ncbi:hypothetical protein FB567DRAFT_182393 [Paraphoma chrysanthemicola]|uniref:Ribosomal protein S10 n=1 Tax=Paraphoma chrysanthemicola TaxID=798071 RepID=A0A8K0QX23_9PLEO|nr:hypothetical protein FB567DRAFT_182393 [Paraphoma chrysanthemicola]